MTGEFAAMPTLPAVEPGVSAHPPLKPSVRGHAARALLVAVAYLAALAIVALVVFFGVLVLAGPHGGLLPPRWTGLALAFGWLVVAVLPLLAARWTWLQLTRGA